MVRKKLLLAHPFSLNDTVSGASMSMRTMLEELVKKGIEVKALCNMIFDSQESRQSFEQQYNLTPDQLNQPFTYPNDPIACIHLPCASWDHNKQTREEQMFFFTFFMLLLDNFKPDVLLTYPDDPLSLAMRAEAKLRGISVVCPILGPTYQKSNFAYIDRATTNSKAMANLYAKKHLNLLPVGVFIDMNKFKNKTIQKSKQQFITLVNPSPAKGLAIAMRLILMAEKELPDITFLFVQGRGNPADAITLLHLPNQPNDRPLSNRSFPNVRVLPNQKDMREVYAQTKVLLAPSLWFEAFGRVAVEALVNGIPVLASQSGGLPEAVGEGGICLETPVHCQQDWFSLPTEEEMRPWMDALKRLVDHKHQDEWNKRALQAAKAYDLQTNVQRMIDVLEPLFALKNSDHVLFLKNRSLNIED